MSFQNYFVYKGKYYGIGTKVKLASSVAFCTNGGSLTKIKNLSEVKRQIYTFQGKIIDGEYTFWWYEEDDPWKRKYTMSSRAIVKEPDNEILEIVEPVFIEMISWQENAINNIFNGEAVADIFGGVLTYIVVMAIALIFKDRWIIWTVTTVIFVWWLLNQYRA